MSTKKAPRSKRAALAHQHPIPTPAPVDRQRDEDAYDDLVALIDGIRARAVVTEYALAADADPVLDGDFLPALGALALQTRQACDQLKAILWPDPAPRSEKGGSR